MGVYWTVPTQLHARTSPAAPTSHTLPVQRSFIKMTLGAPTGVDTDAMKAENEQLRAKCDQLSLQLAEATAKVAALTPGE